MKNKLVLIFFAFLPTLLAAQNKITFLYEPGLFPVEVESLVTSNLKAYNLEYASSIDLNKKCDYYFASLSANGNQIYLEIKDCKDVSKGKALVGNKNQVEIPQAYAGAISFLSNDILTTDKYKTEAPKETKPVFTDNEHASRYFFAPSAYGLKKGELYGTTNYFLLYDFQYGITDNFSLGMGSTIAAFPFYITPKFNFKLDDKNRISVGDMLVLGTWGANFTANLAYAVYTYGESNTNVSLGLAYLNGSNSKDKIGQPVINLSAMARLSDYMYIVSENYFSPGPAYDKLYAHVDYKSGNNTVTNYQFTSKANVAMGALGFRFISKKKDVQSLQFGLAYFIRDYRVTYKGNLKPSLDLYGAPKSETIQIFIPTLSFCYKFGRKI